MANYIEYKDTVAFHPGYYIKELVEETGLSQEEFAKRLDTTPKTLSVLISGGQRLSADIALKLSKMLGTSAEYWLNLQSAFDAVSAQAASAGEQEKERAVLKVLGYGYFRDCFGLPNLPRRVDEQIERVRRLLGVSSLVVLARPDLATSFRSQGATTDENTVIRANAMVQIATNEAIKVEAPKFDRRRFEEAILIALDQTSNHDRFLGVVREEFRKAGVILVILPNLAGSKTNGATKRVNGKIMLMVNDRRLSADTFWFTLFHEIGHILAGEFGVSLEGDEGASEENADAYARDTLIDRSAYERFVSRGSFTRGSICRFSKSIGRDPGIVLGRLQNDGFVSYSDTRLMSLRTKYRVVVCEKDGVSERSGAQPAEG